MLHWLWLSTLIVFLDQVTKYRISEILAVCEPGNCASIVLLPVFEFTRLHNTGAAFSFLDDAGGWQRWMFAAISTGVSTVLIVWLYRLTVQERWLAIALSVVLGGAIGNLIDRVTLGYVVDFILVHYGNYYFPAFNLADSAITIGAGIMILDMLFSKPSQATENIQ
ncbi:MAG: signal peptidase II [Pseudomonadales bacterium]|jgi:signal peptidase II|nr:signal peptidase II [Pseudomonadales bacterium]MDP7146075.1 signal peptidase II [Pseudomonadales bacterium]MDP7360130.1 signal peptidase II [Pseudomonadales bacterium]MDP7594253.1 signal peptidase II [Pseudomonadales bacterium]HJN51817.1 signal peptidase II [Pseudomonadales bacterium]|tara:strand:- start:1712 stop:2209 length:498 start_codon:yes stop_codon:yes gene_type:complete